MRRIVIRYVQYGEIPAVIFSGWLISRSQHSLFAPPSFCPVLIPAVVTHHLKALFLGKKQLINRSISDEMLTKNQKRTYLYPPGAGLTISMPVSETESGESSKGSGKFRLAGPPIRQLQLDLAAARSQFSRYPMVPRPSPLYLYGRGPFP